MSKTKHYISQSQKYVFLNFFHQAARPQREFLDSISGLLFKSDLIAGKQYPMFRAL